MNNLTVFTGPMKCGKTTKLIEEYNKWKHSDKKVAMFKPSIDNRFCEDKVISRNNTEIICYNINSTKDLIMYIDKADIFFIDEFQFLNGEVIDLVKLISKGKQFFISGLNLTSDRKPFGLMNDLLCFADEIILCKAICENCKEYNATYTYCKISKTNDILVGDDVYSPVCCQCYDILKDKETYK